MWCWIHWYIHNESFSFCSFTNSSGRHIAKAIATSNAENLASGHAMRQVQLSSRNPDKIWTSVKDEISETYLLPPVPIDVANPSTLSHAFRDAQTVVSLVGIVHGSQSDFESIQWKGSENVAWAARENGSKLIHFSSIGADPNSHIPYVRTKGLAEESVMKICPTATIVRPSLVFGPEDDFFNRFARLARILPCIPVFGGGNTRFQPVSVNDLGRLVELLSRKQLNIDDYSSGKVIEAGGPEVFTYRQLMELILKQMNLKRPIVSLPFALGKVQANILEHFPVNIFTITPGQVEQLKSDNVIDSDKLDQKHISLEEFMSNVSALPLETLREVLPTYIHRG
ncbi:hypothetical protein CVT24_004316 [Panaeolus cyanescens]|uniref:NAD-dependent epimerase/dehydratase domain-containing protein n=1 Tax=Panaeolus cyanescens TaxID=181874 RepID=A0A409VA94_9AGAR|nr:hypothetical protein CVT24_004316 [Panaeolus cyanescens]